MVKTNDRRKKKGKQSQNTRVAQLGPNTPWGVCSERLSGFGGLLALVKFIDLLKFEEVFERHYVSPGRKTQLGCYRMVLGMLILLFIGFQRLGHFTYIREDSMICGILKVSRLPAVSTFWRYLRSLRIMQSQSLLRVMAVLRARSWQWAGYQPERVSVNLDTTVATVYGEIEGSRKGYNPRHRGKKGLRPVLCFVQETREYLCGKQRRGQTLDRGEIAQMIRSFRRYLPPCVRQVRVRGDEEFVGWRSVEACLKCGYEYTFAESGCRLPWSEEGWYAWGEAEYQECEYRPKGWKKACRFVVMRKELPPQKGEELQGFLLEPLRYQYRMFVTNVKARPHEVVRDYDQRAGVENLIGETQREGMIAIPSKRFQSHHAYFQIVLFAYNLWRWFQLYIGAKEKPPKPPPKKISKTPEGTQTLRVSRLKLLYLAVKLSFHNNRENVYYSIHDSRTAEMQSVLNELDRCRKLPSPWLSTGMRALPGSVP